MALLLALGGIPWQVYFQRVLACRDEKTAVRLSIYAGLGCLLMALPAVFIGVIGSNVDWQNTAAGTAPEASLVLPYVLRYLTPPVVAALGLGAIAAAVMSSVDSSFLSVSGMFSWNVYRPLFRPGASDSETQTVIRVAVVLTGLLSASLALSVRSVYTLWALCGDLVYVVLFPQLLMALYFKKANRWGVVAGLIVGLVLRLGGGEPYLEIPAIIPYPLTGPDGITMFPFRTVAMLSGLVMIWLVSRLTQQRCPPVGM
jgi:high affinity choline transporter 7